MVALLLGQDAFADVVFCGLDENLRSFSCGFIQRALFNERPDDVLHWAIQFFPICMLKVPNFSLLQYGLLYD